jgi:hypothetical protein
MMRRCWAFRVGITTANYITAVVLLSSWSLSSSCHVPVAFAATLIHPGGGGTTQAVEPTTRRGQGPGGRRRFPLKESICRVLHHRQPVISIRNKEPTQWEQYQTRWFRLPEPVRFFVSGNCGNGCLFLCDWMVSLVPPISAVSSSLMPTTTSTTTTTTKSSLSSLSTAHPAVAFFLAYLLHIPAQHALHAALVYGWSSIARTRRQYVTTLLETYSALSLSAVGSAALNGYLRHTVFPNQRMLAFLLTMSLFSVVNFTLMHFIMGTNHHKNHKTA